MKWSWALLYLSGATLAGCGGDSENHRGHADGAKESTEHHHKESHPDKAHADEIKLSAEALERYGIRIGAAEKRTMKPTITAPAVISYDLERVSHVGAQLPGRVVEIQGKLGRRVKQGDPVLVIQSPSFGEAQLLLFEKQVRQTAAQPAVEIARAAFERAKALYDQNRGIPLAEVEKLRGEFRAAEVAAMIAKADVTTAAHRLKLLGMTEQAIESMAKAGQVQPLMTIHAPIDGTIIEVQVGHGELVSPDQESLLTIADDSSLWALVDVPESMTRHLRVGGKAGIQVAGFENEFEGQVTYLASKIDPATRTLAVRVALAGVQGLRAGMFAQAEIEIDAGESAQPVLAIPEQAIQNIEGSTAVFVPVDGEVGAFARRVIRTGPQIGPWVRVTEGLAEGERVVVAGSFILKAELGKGEAGHEH